MNINTKYDLNQSVWFMRDNKPQEHKVGHIQYSFMNDENYPNRTYPRTSYSFRLSEALKTDKWKWEEYTEDKVFATKQELLDSL